jgi:hypothetical protein
VESCCSPGPGSLWLALLTLPPFELLTGLPLPNAASSVVIFFFFHLTSSTFNCSFAGC